MKFGLRPPACIIVSIASLLAACSGPSVPSQSATRPHNVFHVGPFTIRQVHLPPRTRYRTVLPGFTLNIGSSSPYAISRMTWGQSNVTVLGKLDCSQRPTWQTVSGPDAVLLCLGSTVRTAVIQPSGRVSIYAMPVRLPLQLPAKPSDPSKPPDPYGDLSGTIASGYFFWRVSGHAEPDPYGPGPYVPTLAAGTLNLTTGEDSPAPTVWPIVPSTNDVAYGEKSEPDGFHLLRWSGDGYQDLGVLPDARVDAVDATGSAWADQPDETDLYTDSLVVEHAGSLATRSWAIHDGENHWVGPGYMVFESTVHTSTGNVVSLFFPLQHRTIRFRGLKGSDFYDFNLSLRPFGLDELLTIDYSGGRKTFLISQ